MLRPALFALVLAPSAAFAVGSGSEEPPKPTPTTTECPAGQVWDTETRACVASSSSLIDDDIRYEAVRELAYAGRHEAAYRVLATMTDQTESRVQTYHGFLDRVTGDHEAALAHYAAALAADPGNNLARSYLGQAHVAAGDYLAARVELLAIREHGGAGSWAEVALAEAIRTGKGTAY
ncbi:MAG: tetratricopeptide repeat protein [Rhodobacteraceae bacterium]|jgi:thioredoxin-like negative regulator of GroEL|nr:tetratricopeptide repeat protein [Paracoccaceae bacterium]